ncbi:hypothetical protein GGR26_001849 [Lewinella marina]|nr:hypothetical protein [Neolewinella marina]NJB86081.1 hypothetical protein [Neolewinella marina]
MKDCCNSENNSTGPVKRLLNNLTAIIVVLVLAGGAVLALLKVMAG